MFFDIHHKLASGGYGVVHTCSDPNGKTFAVKCIQQNTIGIPCLFEASIMSTINHPFINSAIEICFTDKRLNIIQNLALSDLKTFCLSKSFNFSLYRSWFHMLIQAVHSLHSQNIIHGDIKAQNILVYSDHSIRLSDFTLSTKTTWPPRKMLCTSSHRPYECWMQGEAVLLEKVDIWALGCTFYEILTGTNLFPTQQKYESINALIDWARKGPHLEKAYPCLNTTLAYQSFSLLSSPHSLLYDFMLSLLKFHPQHRPTTHDLLENPLFSDMNQVSYTVKNLTCNLSESSKNRLAVYLLDLNLDSYQPVFTLYSNILTIKGYSERMKILACGFIIYKLIHNEKPKLSVSLTEILELECKICHLIGFQLPLSEL